MENNKIENINTLDKLKELVTVFSIAFEDRYTTNDQYLADMLQSKSTLILGAIADDKVIGGLVAFEFNPIHGSKEFYIYDIAVHPAFHKQGIGKKLIEQLKIQAKQRNVKTIFVEAETEDIGAVAFYRAIGGEEVGVRHFNFEV
jgi:aminoglycoside 3-N-acetyltransferase I